MKRPVFGMQVGDRGGKGRAKALLIVSVTGGSRDVWSGTPAAAFKLLAKLAEDLDWGAKRAAAKVKSK